MNLLDVKDLNKSFGETQALAGCSFTCSAGEIHGIVGENGSGKSTLVKILSGILQPDSGHLLVRDAPAHLTTITQARRLGIVSVPQEILVVPALSVLENVYLGRGGLFSGPPKAEFLETAKQLFSELSETPVNLTATVEDLPLSKQQLVVIVRALVSEPDMLILDESTSALDVSDRDRLFEFLRARRNAGKSAIFISHRIDELQGLADVLTIIRNGKSVKTLNAQEASVDVVVRLMSGTERVDSARDAAVEPWRFLRDADAQLVLRAENVVFAANTPPINLELYKGEIVGLAGLEGHGQERFLQTLAGLSQVVSGHVAKVTGNGEVLIRNLQEAYKEHVSYVPRDRKTEGLFLKLPIIDNFAMPLYSGLIRRGEMTKLLQGFKEKLSMRFDNEHQEVRSLSGGNQQKVVLSRWLATRPEVLLLNDPTRGVDIPTKHDLYRLFRDQAQSNVAIVLLSTDLQELIELCDRVLVFRDGQLFSELDRQVLERERLMSAMFGKAV